MNEFTRRTRDKNTEEGVQNLCGILHLSMAGARRGAETERRSGQSREGLVGLTWSRLGFTLEVTWICGSVYAREDAGRFLC